MPLQNTIRTVTVRGQSAGLDKVSVAQGRLAEASEASARVTETSARRQLSAADAFERVSAQIDPAFRAQQQMARGRGRL
jgi:hypothetical protein